MGGSGNKLIRAVAEVADGWNWALSLDVMKDRIDLLHKHCDELAKDFKKIEKSWDSWVIVAPTDEEVKKKIKHLSRGIRRAMDEFNLSSLEEYKKISVVGTPEVCAERINQYVSIGVTYFMFWFVDYPDISGIRTFAAEVMPEFK